VAVTSTDWLDELAQCLNAAPGDGPPAIFFGIRGLRMRHRDDRTVGDGALRIDGLSRDAADADKHEDTSHRPNEKEISHGRVSWQARWSRYAMGALASSIG
jgi:hypothetical protein